MWHLQRREGNPVGPCTVERLTRRRACALELALSLTPAGKTPLWDGPTDWLKFVQSL